MFGTIFDPGTHPMWIVLIKHNPTISYAPILYGASTVIVRWFVRGVILESYVAVWSGVFTITQDSNMYRAYLRPHPVYITLPVA